MSEARRLAREAREWPSKARTFREACAREIDMMVRGHVAHEAAALIPLRNALRELPLERRAEDAIMAAVDTCFAFRDEQTLGEYRRLFTLAALRVFTGIELMHDPMVCYTDNAKWWPRA